MCVMLYMVITSLCQCSDNSRLLWLTGFLTVKITPGVVENNSKWIPIAAGELLKRHLGKDVSCVHVYVRLDLEIEAAPPLP